MPGKRSLSRGVRAFALSATPILLAGAPTSLDRAPRLLHLAVLSPFSCLPPPGTKEMSHAGELRDLLRKRYETVRVVLSRCARASPALRVSWLDRVRHRGGDPGASLERAVN